MTAPRPGMLPAPVNPATVPPPNPYLGHAARADVPDIQPEPAASADHAARAGRSGRDIGPTFPFARRFGGPP